MSEQVAVTPEGETGLRPAADPRAAVCSLCGLPLSRSGIREQVPGGEALLFCCPGCRQVFLLLSGESGCLPADFKETALYRVCAESGVISGGIIGTNKAPANDLEPGLPPLEMTVRVEGMWCPACAWLIEEVLKRTAGVLESRVCFLSDIAQVRYLPHLVSPEEITATIARLGYRISPMEQTGQSGAEKKGIIARLGISAILTANVMMLSFALYSGFLRELPRTVIGYFSYPLLVVATPVVFYGGYPIVRRAVAGLRYRVASMDTLISLGALTAYFYSVVQMVRGSIHLYFDTTCMLVTLSLLGRYVETRAREKVSSGIFELYELAHRKVRLLTHAGERWVSSEVVQEGDRFVVRPNERSPADGRIIAGNGVLDESILTGESRPIRKGPGDEVMAGTLVREGKLAMTVSRKGSENTLRQLTALVQDALSRKDPIELTADRITRVFVPGIVALAGVTALVLWLGHAPAHEILLRALTVLLIACPCALGIAAPLVKVALIGIGRSKGILVREPGALEGARELDVLILDKTGTVTEGSFVLQEIITDGVSEKEILSRIAPLEQDAPHFLAAEVVRRARAFGIEPSEPDSMEELGGRGVKGRLCGEEIVVGNRRLMREQGVSLTAALEGEAAAREKEGMTVVFAAWGREVKGILVFGDPLRAGARDLVDLLKARGVSVRLVSGDAWATTAAVAESLGIEEFRGQMLPDEKADFVRSLKRQGLKTGMVGDGLNDAAALAEADVGIAFGIHPSIIRGASDVTILSADLSRLLEVLAMSKLAAKTIRQNLVAAFSYNVMALPIAVSGLLNPLIAVMAMFGSSFFVIANALRIARTRKGSVPPGRDVAVALADLEGIG